MQTIHYVSELNRTQDQHACFRLTKLWSHASQTKQTVSIKFYSVNNSTCSFVFVFKIIKAWCIYTGDLQSQKINTLSVISICEQTHPFGYFLLRRNSRIHFWRSTNEPPRDKINKVMPSLIWVFAWRTATLLVLSCRGSNVPYRLWFYISSFVYCRRVLYNKT